MKKDRRQELQTNILADRLGGAIQRIGPYLKSLGIVLAVAVVSLGGLLWWNASSRAQESALWEKFLAISFEAELAKSASPDTLSTRTRLERELSAYLSVAADLQALAKANQGAPAVGWIRSAAGGALLAVGMRQLYSDQPEARLTLLRAKAVYEDLMRAATADEELYDRIRYGYGQTCEALSIVASRPELHDEYLSNAQEYYRDLTQNGKSSGIKRLAEYRLRILAPISGKTWEEAKKTPERGDWASWLSLQELPEEERAPSDDGTGGGPNQFPLLQNGGTFDPSAFPALLQSGDNESTDPAQAKDPDAPPPTEKGNPEPADPKDPPTEKGNPEPADPKDPPTEKGSSEPADPKDPPTEKGSSEPAAEKDDPKPTATPKK